jgi:hypothetical protein
MGSNPWLRSANMISDLLEDGFPPDDKNGRNFSGSWNISGTGLELGLTDGL